MVNRRRLYLHLRIPPSVFAIAALLAYSCVPVLASNIAISGWRPAFQGVDQATGAIDSPDASIAYALRIDLAAPGISFLTTSSGGNLNTISETTAQFLTSTGASAAINANFFAPCCDPFPEDKTVIGLAVSKGSVVAVSTAAPGSSNVALLLTRTNTASIQTTTAAMDLSSVFNAVAGSAVIVQNGQNVGALSPNEGDPANPNPRTDVGISQDGRFLYLVVIDGRQAPYSIGTNIVETANILISFGAYTAMNLDGGGSTSLVEADGKGGVIDVNRPSSGAERYDANHLGVFALPLDVPEPAPLTLLVLALPVWLLLRRAKRSLL